MFVLSKVKPHWNLLKHTDFKITGSGCYLKKEKKKTIEICVMSYLCGERRIALVNLPQSVEHFGQLWWIHWLHCNLDDWCCVELQRPKNLSLKGRVKKKNMRIWIWLFFYFSKTLGIFFCRSPTSSFPLGSVIVAVLTIGWSQPSMRTQLPAGTRFTSIWYLK